MKCIIIDDDQISINALQHCISKAPFLDLIGSFNNSKEALEFTTKELPDLIFLDIEMPEISGLDFLRILTYKPQVIFVTSNKDYALDAFDFNIDDFLLKPLVLSRFLNAVNKVKDRWNIKKNKVLLHPEDHSIFVKSEAKLIKINTENILMIEALADYVSIYTDTKTFTIHGTMKGFESKLPPDEFIRIHRSYIVRFNAITEIENNHIRLGKKLLPIGKNYKDNLLKRINLI